MRCSRASLERGESQVGTASTVRSFLLVECPGPWGVDALTDSRLPEEVRTWLAGLRGTRPLLIRRGATNTARVFTSQGGVLRTVELSDVRELPRLDLQADLSPYDGQLFLVCAHGRHDACCAEFGRPVWQAMAASAPEETWQVSQIGGDRFAANVLVLPDGLYYGRLLPEDVEIFVATHRAGCLDLDHLRGRCAFPFAAQAAEVFLRRELGETRAGAVRLLESTESGASFDTGGRTWRVEVVRTTSRELLTCRAGAAGEGWAYSLAGITEVTVRGG